MQRRSLDLQQQQIELQRQQMQQTQMSGAQPSAIVEAQKGCRVWNPHPQPNESVTWSGPCQNGLAQGIGVEQWFKNGQPGNRIEGDFQAGKVSRGVVIFPNGDRYEGQLSDDGKSMKGHGVLTYANGERLEAEFRPTSSAK